MSSFVTFNSFAVSQVTFETDKSSYTAGDTVTITGNVINSSNQLVAVEVKDPNGNILVLRTVQTDSNGDYELKFKLPPSAPSGNYNIIANSKINGTMVTETKTIVQTSVVPEFPFAIYALMIGVISVIFIQKIRNF